MDERRPVSWGRLIRRHKLWWPAITLAFVLAAVVFGLYLTARARTLERDGIEVAATVTDRVIERSRTGNSTRRRYIVAYTFTTEAGQTVRAREAVGEGPYNRLSVGTQAPVRYVPQDPGNHTILPDDSRVMAAWVAFGFAGLVSLMTLIFGVKDFRSKSSALRAGREGAVRAARVDEHLSDTPGFGRRRGPPQHRFRWTDETGAQGTSEPMGNAAKLPPVGGTVRVYLDPRTAKAWWEGDF